MLMKPFSSSFLSLLMISLISLFTACADMTSDQSADTDLEEGALDDVEKSTPRSCNQRWIPSSLLTNRQNVPYESPGRRCTGKAQPGAISFGNYVRDHFHQLVDLSVDGDGIQIYNCRSVRGGGSPSVHSEGRAIDIFIPMKNGTANNQKGDIIANWLIDNAKTIGIQYMIWDRTSWKASGDVRQKCYTGTHPHNDHIHVELTWKAARQETPFFSQGIFEDPNWSDPNQNVVPPVNPNQPSDPQPNDPQPNDPNQPSDPQPIDPQPSDPQPSDPQPSDPQPSDPNQSIPSPTPNTNSWIGDPCTTDLDCAFTVDGTRGRCFLAHQPVSQQGFCSLACNGFCPDAVNEAVTFCISASEISSARGGVCVSKSGAKNDYCNKYAGYQSKSVSRYIGTSNASASSSDVCVPSASQNAGTGNGEGNGGACSISDIPFGDNNQSCQGVPAETWRCACSQRLDSVVSQVCRNGVWINFQTNPSNCDRCDGAYTSGCAP